MPRQRQPAGSIEPELARILTQRACAIGMAFVVIALADALMEVASRETIDGFLTTALPRALFWSIGAGCVTGFATWRRLRRLTRSEVR